VHSSSKGKADTAVHQGPVLKQGTKHGHTCWQWNVARPFVSLCRSVSLLHQLLKRVTVTVQFGAAGDPALQSLLPSSPPISPLPPPHIPAQLTTLLPAVCVAAAAPPALGGCSQPETQGTCRIQMHTQMWHHTKHPSILIGLLGNSLIVSPH
jgi:hypothetical protein